MNVPVKSIEYIDGANICQVVPPAAKQIIYWSRLSIKK